MNHPRKRSRSTPTSAILTEQQAAALINCKRPTLTAWRRKRVGPAYYQIGRLIRYSQDDLAEFLERNRRNPDIAQNT
jgi:excisionase family DNA binding protein